MNVETRQAIEKQIAEKAIECILTVETYCISIWDSEDWAIERSRDPKAIIKAMFSTDQDEMVVYHCDKENKPKMIGSIAFIYGNDGWDVMADYSMSLDTLIRPAYDLADQLEQQYGN